MSMIVPHEQKTDGKWQDLKTLGPLPQQVDCNGCPVSPASHFYGSSCWKTWQPPEPGQHDNKKNCKLIHSEWHPRTLEPIRIQALDVINDFQLATLRIQSCKSSQSTSCRTTQQQKLTCLPEPGLACPTMKPFSALVRTCETRYTGVMKYDAKGPQTSFPQKIKGKSLQNTHTFAAWEWGKSLKMGSP